MATLDAKKRASLPNSAFAYVDAAGRRQYLYHPHWRAARDQAKHERVLEIAARLRHTSPIASASRPVARLPPLHRDPFDRMLVSQAIVHGLVLLTPDPLVTQYPARTLW